MFSWLSLLVPYYLPPVNVCEPDGMGGIDPCHLVFQFLTLVVSDLHAIHCLSLHIYTPKLHIRFALQTIKWLIVALLHYLYTKRLKKYILQT